MTRLRGRARFLMAFARKKKVVWSLSCVRCAAASLDGGVEMLKSLLQASPSVRQAMLLGEQGPLEVATVDDAVTPAEALEQQRAFTAIGARLSLGSLRSAATADTEVSLSFHEATEGTLAVVAVARPDKLGEHLADIEARTRSAGPSRDGHGAG